PDHPFARPGGLMQVEVCNLSGLLPTPLCPHTRTEWFIAGTEPTQTDTFYQQVWIDGLTKSLADDSTPVERRGVVTVLDLPAEAQNWAREQGLPLLTDYSLESGSLLPNSREQAPESTLILLSPPANTTYRIDPDFDPASQQIQIEVAAGAGISQITVWVDGKPLATLPAPPYQAWWTLSAGEHRFWAEGVNANGESVKSDETTITVLAK
ncbi:MAG: hypothetical protein ACM33V_04890, partial [Chloroflexota bacterium]